MPQLRDRRSRQSRPKPVDPQTMDVSPIPIRGLAFSKGFPIANGDLPDQVTTSAWAEFIRAAIGKDGSSKRAGMHACASFPYLSYRVLRHGRMIGAKHSTGEISMHTASAILVLSAILSIIAPSSARAWC